MTIHLDICDLLFQVYMKIYLPDCHEYNLINNHHTSYKLIYVRNLSLITQKAKF